MQNCICKDRFCRTLKNCDSQCMVCNSKSPYKHWEQDFDDKIADVNRPTCFASGVTPITVKIFIRKLIDDAARVAFARGKKSLVPQAQEEK